MKTIRVITTNSSWITNANGTQKELDAYFVGQLFDVGSYPIEKMERCVKVEILNTYLASFIGCHLGAIESRESLKDIEVIEANKDAARLALYDNYERIQNLELKLI